MPPSDRALPMGAKPHVLAGSREGCCQVPECAALPMFMSNWCPVHQEPCKDCGARHMGAVLKCAKCGRTLCANVPNVARRDDAPDADLTRRFGIDRAERFWHIEWNGFKRCLGALR